MISSVLRWKTVPSQYGGKYKITFLFSQKCNMILMYPLEFTNRKAIGPKTRVMIRVDHSLGLNA